jgi:hypothetical protein
MDLLNWSLLAVLTSLAGLAVIAVALRLDLAGRAERALAAWLLFWALIVAPVLILGYSNYLYRAPLGLSSAALSSAVLVWCARGRALKDFLRELSVGVRELLGLLPEAVRLCLRARSFAALGLLCCVCVCALTLLLTYLMPADESWDGLYYHQPIVGFALQQHGFGLVDLPNTLLAQTINGYPKLGEAFSLWFVIFTDKTLIELGSSLAAPGLLLAVYLLIRRYTPDRAACIGWASVVLLVPAISSQLRTTMIDVELWLFALGAIYFATRTRLRPRDAALALLAGAMVLGTKSTGLVLVPPVVLLLCARALRGQPRAAFAFSISLGLLLIAAIASLTFVRNFRAFHNPFWPVSYSNRALGIEFRGLATVAQVAPDLKFPDFLRQLYEHPAGGVHDIIAHGYGCAVPWIVLPLGALGLIVCLFAAMRGALQHARDRVAENLLLVAFVTLGPLCASPSWSNARYNLQAVVLGLVAIAWLSERWSAERLREGALAGSVLLSVMSLFWSGYLWGLGLTLPDIGSLLHHTKAERASMNFSGFQMPAPVAALREAELGAGEVSVFTQELSFIGVLWNDRFSNQVSYLPMREARSFQVELLRRHARWVAVGAKSMARRALDRSPDYELVGTAAEQDKTVIYRLRADQGRGEPRPKP